MTQPFDPYVLGEIQPIAQGPAVVSSQQAPANSYQDWLYQQATKGAAEPAKPEGEEKELRQKGLALLEHLETVEIEEKNEKGEVVRTVKRDGASGAWTYFPNRLDVRGRLLPSTRRLGLHEVRVYELQATAEASFSAEIPADEKSELPRRIGQR
jgi:hypothetical protein